MPDEIVSAYCVAVTIGVIGIWEALWGFQYFPLGGAFSGRYHVAQVRTLTEDSELPYGQGVFVKRQFIPLWATSKLVFAAYCERAASVEWQAVGRLAVNCVLTKDGKLNFSTPTDIDVVHKNVTVKN